MFRSPLAVIDNAAAKTCVTKDGLLTPSIESDLSSLTKGAKRVRFEATGVPPFPVDPDLVALLLAEKHETTPSTLKMSEFTETLDLLKSASAWDKFSLKRFGVKFASTKYTELTTLMKDQKWYDLNTETTVDDFADRNNIYEDVVDIRV